MEPRMRSVGLSWFGACLLFVLALDPGRALAATTKTFSAQGCGHTIPANLFTVPAGVSRVQITATGSAGQGAAAGTGDVVSGTLSGLRSGRVLDICVDYGGGSAGAGSLQNGGAGGGASGVGLGSDFAMPVLIAGGGGGSASSVSNGERLTDRGGNAGRPGAGGGSVNGDGGGGGTQTTFGTGGAADPSCGGTCTGGSNGARFTRAGPGLGGGGGSNTAGDGGGGGGGGYYGGGGGGSSEILPGGGGGGSDFCASSLTRPASLSHCRVTGANATYGKASVVLTYTQAAWAHDLRDLLVDSRGVGPGHTLVHKVKLAKSKYMAGDASGACRTLDGYIREVNKQTGTTITKAQARDLIEDAHETQKAIGCSSR